MFNISLFEFGFIFFCYALIILDCIKTVPGEIFNTFKIIRKKERMCIKYFYIHDKYIYMNIKLSKVIHTSWAYL